MALVQAETEDPLLRQRLTETVDWCLREMVADGGGFAATQDADSEGDGPRGKGGVDRPAGNVCTVLWRGWRSADAGDLKRRSAPHIAGDGVRRRSDAQPVLFKITLRRDHDLPSELLVFGRVAGRNPRKWVSRSRNSRGTCGPVPQ